MGGRTERLPARCRQARARRRGTQLLRSVLRVPAHDRELAAERSVGHAVPKPAPPLLATRALVPAKRRRAVSGRRRRRSTLRAARMGALSQSHGQGSGKNVHATALGKRHADMYLHIISHNAVLGPPDRAEMTMNNSHGYTVTRSASLPSRGPFRAVIGGLTNPHQATTPTTTAVRPVP
jgi:hypothetical protein